MSSSSTDPARLLEVGRIEKPHGVRGDVIVRLTTNRTERVAPGSVLHTTGGATRTVVSSRPHQDRHLVTFAEISSREAADAARGEALFAPPIEDPDELWVHDLIGAEVHDAAGVARGRVVDVVANPASDLLQLASGALVPVRFITHVEPGVRIEVDVPDGLFELTD